MRYLQRSLACYQHIGQICVMCQLLAVAQLHCICGWGLYCPCFLSVPSMQSSSSSPLSICWYSCIACLCSYKDNEVIVQYICGPSTVLVMWHLHMKPFRCLAKRNTIAECIKAQLQHIYKQTIVACEWKHLPIGWHVELNTLGMICYIVIAAVYSDATTILLAW